ncbi:MAG: AzlD domain-containing protein [Solirubrobacteraceae bacterium]|nr:AzlD domain-containing protein [Solirubrobacteraceae bacterium]
MSTTVVIVIVGLTVTTAAIKAIGPIASGGRELPPWALDIVALLAPALLAALVVTQIFADGKTLAVGEETVGVAAAGAVMWKTESVVGCVVTAAVVTAALRALA